MQTLDKPQLAELLKQAHVRSRLAKELRFAPDDYTWDDSDFIAIAIKSGAEGVLIVELAEPLVLPYTLSTRLVDKQTGRSKPITCDFCYTWQNGGKAARITFVRPADGHSITYLCCADLRCSQHVRDKTPESIVSRSQLHEDMTLAQRVVRLRRNLQKLLGALGYAE